MCQIDVLYGKSLIIDFLDDFLKKRTAIRYLFKIGIQFSNTIALLLDSMVY